MKKVYTIEVVKCGAKHSWYFNNIGYQFEAIIKAKGYGDFAMFWVAEKQKFIRPEDCRVISEKLIQK